jgi:hypothetical protein
VNVIPVNAVLTASVVNVKRKGGQNEKTKKREGICVLQ